jgi:hypothetical protein
MTKRLSYEKIRISTLGGSVEVAPATDGWSVRYEPPTNRPLIGYGKSIEESGQQLVQELKRIAQAVEDDLKAFVERNK